MRFRIVEEIKQTTAQDIVDEYGTTSNWRETGFILRDGTQVDLSGKRFGAGGNSRTVDHREPFEDGTDDLIKFITQGNIRVLPEYPGINLAIEPTEVQYQKIKELVIKLGYTNDYFSIDFDDKNGNTKASKEYSENINVRKILDDIRFYFKNGKLPYESELSLFREDLNIPMSDEYDSEGNQLTKAQVGFFEDSKVRDRRDRLLVCYHGTNSIFDVFEKGDIGFHFGTLKQARYRKEIKNGKDLNILKVYLNIKEKYFEFDKDLMWWDPQTIAIELLFGDTDSTLGYYKNKVLNTKESIKAHYTEFEGKEDDLKEIILNYSNKNGENIYNNKYSKKLRSLFKGLKFNGIKYVNQGEDDGGDYSYIVFEKNQIKSITNKNPSSSDNINEVWNEV